MDRYPNCGGSAGSLDVYECVVCNKKFCANCSSKIPLYGIRKKHDSHKAFPSGDYDKWKTGELWKELEYWKEVGYAHSQECATQFVSDFQTALQKTPTLVSLKDDADVLTLVNSLPKESAERLRQFDIWNDFWFNYEVWHTFNDLCFETQAMNLERAGQFEEAARHYDTLASYHNLVEQRPQYLDKTRQAREKSRIFHVKETVVDINKLLEQVRDGGIVAVYRCLHCGGKVKVGKDASVESLKVCEHCGSEIEGDGIG